MGKPREPEPAKLFVSLIAMEKEVSEQGMGDLRSAFGETDTVSETLPFDFTDYYTPEMGKPLFRSFVTFKRLIPIPSLPEIKQATNCLEEKYASAGGNRRINIDPGYVCLGHVILATTKGYTHRPYLRNGIYADLELIYRDKSFQALAWTYPDYRQEKVIRLFNQFRKEYLEDLREGKYRLC